MNTVIANFKLEAKPVAIQPFGAGHINDSLRIITEGPKEYFLQRINHNVFPNVEGMMGNIDLVTRHIRGQLTTATGEAATQRTLTIVPTNDGQLFQRDEDGNYWRVYEFFTDLHSYELLETPEQAYAGAKAYGYFLRLLDDAPAEQIVDIIPHFHDINRRLAALEASWRADGAGRGRRCKALYQVVGKHADRMREIQRRWDTGQLPTRITHNDTKFNNVLFDAADNGVCVVDLDTVMQGVVHFDFGDGVRTGAATAHEDEADLQLVTVDRAKYRAFREGYLEVTQDCLSPLEIQLLPLAGPLLAYIMGVRFLTDFLAGDTYYKTAYPDHNLVRASNQLKLTEEFIGVLGL